MSGRSRAFDFMWADEFDDGHSVPGPLPKRPLSPVSSVDLSEYRPMTPGSTASVSTASSNPFSVLASDYGDDGDSDFYSETTDYHESSSDCEIFSTTSSPSTYLEPPTECLDRSWRVPKVDDEQSGAIHKPSLDFYLGPKQKEKFFSCLRNQIVAAERLVESPQQRYYASRFVKTTKVPADQDKQVVGHYLLKQDMVGVIGEFFAYNLISEIFGSPLFANDAWQSIMKQDLKKVCSDIREVNHLTEYAGKETADLVFYDQDIKFCSWLRKNWVIEEDEFQKLASKQRVKYMIEVKATKYPMPKKNQDRRFTLSLSQLEHIERLRLNLDDEEPTVFILLGVYDIAKTPQIGIFIDPLDRQRNPELSEPIPGEVDNQEKRLIYIRKPKY